MSRVGARPILSKMDGPGRSAAHEMWALYGPFRAERSMRRPMCYDGPTRTAAHEMWCTTCYYDDDVHRAHEAAHVF